MSDTDTRKHILVLNESQDVLELFTELLEGYRVTTQPYLATDFESIITMAPDLILLDYMWDSDDDGWSLLQMLKMEPRTESIPVVVCTGAVVRVEGLRPHLESMNVRVVIKPFNIAALLQVLNSALESIPSG